MLRLYYINSRKCAELQRGLKKQDERGKAKWYVSICVRAHTCTHRHHPVPPPSILPLTSLPSLRSGMDKMMVNSDGEVTITNDEAIHTRTNGRPTRNSQAAC